MYFAFVMTVIVSHDHNYRRYMVNNTDPSGDYWPLTRSSIIIDLHAQFTRLADWEE